MKTFQCHCGNSLHFENSYCLSCNRMVGYLPEERQLSAFELLQQGLWRALFNDRVYRQCKNYLDYNVCNWMVAEDDDSVMCLSCRLNHIIPNLNETKNITLWYRIEQAKRRLLYTLYSLNLPVINRFQDPARGLCFEFLSDKADLGEFNDGTGTSQKIITGHHFGKITINLLEAEHSSRMAMRDKMNERYRTLLGHFRHESGHYYWDLLINETVFVGAFREMFGDERLDYDQALSNYYEYGPPQSWQDQWISAYASAHAWEDWAETWAHYLHMVDTLETAHDFGFRIHGYDISAPGAGIKMGSGYFKPVIFDALFEDWRRLSVALNALNRSMGMDDAYPFVISNRVLDKLRFVHRVVTDANHQAWRFCFPNQNEATD